LATVEYSLSGEGEEEESDGGQPPERWEPALPSRRAAEAAEEKAPATRRSTEGAERGSGDGGRHHSAHRALEEKEAGLPP
jgi:hypothetical protein